MMVGSHEIPASVAEEMIGWQPVVLMIQVPQKVMTTKTTTVKTWMRFVACYSLDGKILEL
jgi:hypothetical protein